MKVLLVDDSVAYRSKVRAILNDSSEIQEVAVAPNGSLALKKIEQKTYDVLVLDIEMPELNGVETVREVRGRGYQDIRIVMFAAESPRSALMILDAIHAGANDVVIKPKADDDPVAKIKDELIPKILQFQSRPKLPEVKKMPNAEERPQTPIAWKRLDLEGVRPDVIGVASSTGGPDALEALFAGIGSGSTPPILIVQHMPPVFTKLLAERLDGLSNISFREASDGDALESGLALIAPGDFHMEIVNGTPQRVRLNQGPKQNSVRPAADPLFASIADIHGSKGLGIVLTGMGEDGLAGAVALKNAGAGMFIQDRESSIVWGMPGAVFNAGAFDQCGDIDECRRLVSSLSVQRSFGAA